MTTASAKHAEIKKKHGKEKSLKKHKHEAPCKCSGNSIQKSVGEVVITVQRTSFNIHSDLPYCLFGTLYVTGNNFGTPLQQFLPEGVTVSTTLEGQNVTFTYSNGTASDQIIVSVPGEGLINYLEFLTNLNTNYMRSEFLIFDCNAGDNPPSLADSQIRKLKGKGIFLYKISGLNSKDYQLIIPGTRRSGENTVPSIAEIYLRNEPIKIETLWVHSFAYIPLSVPATRLLFNFTLFISERINMNDEQQKIRME